MKLRTSEMRSKRGLDGVGAGILKVRYAVLSPSTNPKIPDRAEMRSNSDVGSGVRDSRLEIVISSTELLR